MCFIHAITDFENTRNILKRQWLNGHISVYTKNFRHLYKLVQLCKTLKTQKVTSVTSYVWILKSSSRQDHTMVS
jgi:hypothetical protein